MLRSLAVLSLLVGSVAWAQEEEDVPAGRTVKYLERQEIDFPDINLSGELAKPSITPIDEVKRPAFPPMIKLRTDFKVESKASVDEVK